MSTWYLLATSSAEALSLETAWNVAAILLSSLIALMAAIYAADRSARLTMANARELQNRERRRDEKSVAALLSVDLHGKLSLLVRLLPQRNLPASGLLSEAIINLEQRLASRVVLEAALPKLGSLGHRDSASLLAAYNGLALLVVEARRDIAEQIPGQLLTEMKETANHIGLVLSSLWRRYEIDRPTPLEEMGLDLESRDVKFLTTLGI